MPQVIYSGRQSWFGWAALSSDGDEPNITFSFEGDDIKVVVERDERKLAKTLTSEEFLFLIFGQEIENLRPAEQENADMAIITFDQLVKADAVLEYCEAYDLDPDAVRYMPHTQELAISVDDIKRWL